MRTSSEGYKEMKTVLVTGSAGFIGYHLCSHLIDEGFRVVGFDGITDYYDVRLKERRHSMLNQKPGFSAKSLVLKTPTLCGTLWPPKVPM